MAIIIPRLSFFLDFSRGEGGKIEGEGGGDGLIEEHTFRGLPHSKGFPKKEETEKFWIPDGIEPFRWL